MQRISKVLEWENMSSKHPMVQQMSKAIEREFRNEVLSGEVLQTDIPTSTQRPVEASLEGFSDCSLETGTSRDSDAYESSFIDDDSQQSVAEEDNEWEPQQHTTTVEQATTGDTACESDMSDGSDSGESDGSESDGSESDGGESDGGESDGGESDGEGDSGESDSATATPDPPL